MNDTLGVTAIHFTPYDAAGNALLRDEELPQEVFSVHDTAFFGLVAAKIVTLRRRKEPAAQEQAKWLMHALIAELIHHHEDNTAPEMRYRLRIEAQVAKIFEQPGLPWSVRDLARELHLSPDHFTRVFQRLMGRPPRELIQEARLQRACQMLSETPLSVSEVADQTGYADVFQFSRLFKRHMKLPPSRWRAELQGQQTADA